jgi:hypothetical protein
LEILKFFSGRKEQVLTKEKNQRKKVRFSNKHLHKSKKSSNFAE